MTLFRPQNWLDRLFAIGIVLKGLDGLGELIGGVLLLFVQPETITRLTVLLTRGEEVVTAAPRIPEADVAV